MSSKKETKVEPVVEAKVEAKAETKVESPVKPERKKENLMYLGPTIPGVIRHGTVFKDGKRTAKIQECIEALPMMERLFVCEKDVTQTIKDLNKQQSAVGNIAKTVAQTFLRR